MQRIEVCDSCKRKFYRSFVIPSKSWSKLNDVLHWTDGKEIKEGWKVLCRKCLSDWRENNLKEYMNLVSIKKRRTFNGYKAGAFLKNDLVNN